LLFLLDVWPESALHLRARVSLRHARLTCVIGLLCWAVTNSAARADPPRSVLLVLAHPDDETMMGATLGRLKELGVQVHAVYATQGEGGRIMAHEGGEWVEVPAPDRDALAARRSKELHRALKWFGVRDYRPLAERDDPKRNASGTPTRDGKEFLASGTWDEAFLKDQIRAYAGRVQPDAVFTLLPDNPHVHAHHQAIGMLALDLFHAGGLGARVQQVYGIEERGWYPEATFAGTRTKIRFETGALAPRFGMSYAEFSAEGAHQHASQAAGHRTATVEEVFQPLVPGRPDVLDGLLKPMTPAAAARSSFFGRVNALVRRTLLKARGLGPGPRKVGPLASHPR
jgi:LmbE family N-acetylglucosaminyl deacetylase